MLCYSDVGSSNYEAMPRIVALTLDLTRFPPLEYAIKLCVRSSMWENKEQHMVRLLEEDRSIIMASQEDEPHRSGLCLPLGLNYLSDEFENIFEEKFLSSKMSLIH